jgi:ubiquitin carboxyl-terminal hydrolase L5
MSNWCLIESDPGVFTELFQKIGVKNAQVEELICLEDDFLYQIQPIFGLIFCFKMAEEKEKREVLKEYDPSLFYAEQVINNACATQAILSILMNCPHVDVGEELGNLKNFTVGMSAKDIGYTLGNSDTIREAHNSFARQEPFDIEERRATKDDDVFHFISYVPFNGKLYELDGLQGGPIELADVDEETWLPIAREEINKRIANYEAKEVRFNLLAVTGDLLNKYETEIKESKLKVKHLSAELGKAFEGEVEGELTQEQKDSLPSDNEGKEKLLSDLQNGLYELEDKRKEEQEKRDKWARENQRRRHNYVPLVLEMLKVMSEKKMLTDLYKTAEEKHKKKLEEKEKEKADAAA